MQVMYTPSNGTQEAANKQLQVTSPHQRAYVSIHNSIHAKHRRTHKEFAHIYFPCKKHMETKYHVKKSKCDEV